MYADDHQIFYIGSDQSSVSSKLLESYQVVWLQSSCWKPQEIPNYEHWVQSGYQQCGVSAGKLTSKALFIKFFTSNDYRNNSELLTNTNYLLMKFRIKREYDRVSSKCRHWVYSQCTVWTKLCSKRTNSKLLLLKISTSWMFINRMPKMCAIQ